MMHRSVTRILPTLLLGTLAVFLGGCASSYEVKVDSISQPQAKEVASYKIQPRNGSDEPSSLRYQEATNFIKTALSGKGLYEAPADEEALIERIAERVAEKLREKLK